MQITLEELALAASTNTDVAVLTSTLAKNNDFLSLSAYVEEDGYIDLSKITNDILQEENENLTPLVFDNHYDRMVKEYLGENYKAITLADVEVPSDFSISNCIAATSSLRTNLVEKNTKHLEIFAKNPDVLNIGNCFAEIKEDGTSVLNTAAISKKIEFLEFVKTISVQDVEKNPAEVGTKIMFMFTESIKPLLNLDKSI